MMPTIFLHTGNRGYKNWASVLKSVNGIKIKNFRHLVAVLDNVNEKYTKFEFLEQSTIILDTKKAKESLTEITNIYRLKSDRNFL